MTADTYSSTLGFLIMGTGNDNNSWGTNANNSVFQVIEDAIANALTSTVTGGTLDLSASPPPAAASQVRYAALIFNGALGSNQIVEVPNLQKFWFVQNGTSAAFTLTFKTPTGTASTAIPQNSGWQVVYCDGANNIVVFPFNTNQIQMPDGTISAPPLSNVNETNSGWRRAGTQDWRLTINGADVLQVTGTGAGTPSIVNVLSPNTFQIAGMTITAANLVPAGMEAPYAGITVPAGWLWEDGSAYSRTTYSGLLAALTATCTGNTHTTTTLDSLSVDLRGKGLEGAYIEGTGIPTGTTISSIDSATSLTLSVAATGTASGVSIRALPWGQGDGSTTFNVPDRRYRAWVGRDNMNNNPAGRSSAFAGTKLNTAGGEESHTLTLAETPSHTISGTTSNDSPDHTHNYATVLTESQTGAGGGNYNTASTTGTTAGANSRHTHTFSASNGGGGGSHNNMSPFGITNCIIKT